MYLQINNMYSTLKASIIYVHIHTYMYLLQPDCSLHLASQFSLSRYYVSPIYTQESTPGIIMASGTYVCCVCVCVCVFLFVYFCMCIFVCVCICVYVHTYACIYTYVHTYVSESGVLTQ